MPFRDGGSKDLMGRLAAAAVKFAVETQAQP
jgi:hypothetical protein